MNQTHICKGENCDDEEKRLKNKFEKIALQNIQNK
jgi:hypothetical protein